MKLHEQLETLISSKNSAVQTEIELLKERESKLKSLARRTTYVANVFEEDSSITKALKKAGLEIDTLRIVTTGADCFDKNSVNNEAHFEATLIPTNEKFKFIAFAGYDSRGAGKNHKRLRAKQEKLENALSSDDFRASINHYSLEDNATGRVNREAPNRVMISWRPNFK